MVVMAGARPCQMQAQAGAQQAVVIVVVLLFCVSNASATLSMGVVLSRNPWSSRPRPPNHQYSHPLSQADRWKPPALVLVSLPFLEETQRG